MLLGNLSVEQIEKEYGVEFSAEDKEWLKTHRQENVSILLEKDKWHCFDMPRVIATGSEEFRDELYHRLSKYDFKGKIMIAIMND